MPSQCFFTPLYQVATVINSSLNPQDVLQKVVEQVTKALHGKACSIRLLDRTGKHLLPSVSYGLSKGYLKKGKIEVAKSHIDSELMRTAHTVYIKDAATDKRFQYPEEAKAEGIVSILVAPLRIDDKNIGVLRLYTDKERTFTQPEQDFLLAVSHVAAIAIENARLHEGLRADFELADQYNYLVFED